jgi:hypothetical protein
MVCPSVDAAVVTILTPEFQLLFGKPPGLPCGFTWQNNPDSYANVLGRECSVIGKVLL